MTAGLRVTGSEAFLVRSRGTPIQLLFRDDDPTKVGYWLRVTAMEVEGRTLVIEGTRRWASATLRLECPDPDRALRVLRAVGRRTATYRTRSNDPIR